MNSKVWFITGTSRGFGRVWAEAALKRGDKVVATARNINSLKSLVEQYGDAILPIALDVTDREADFAAIRQAKEHFGKIDIVINNAGYGHFGAIEEVTESEVRAQMETNFFGALWITQAALTVMREQKSGHILPVSSIGGVTTFATLGIYHASKWALEAFSETAAREVEEFGIKFTIIEPGGYATDWGGTSSKHSLAKTAYDSVREKRFGTIKSNSLGKPEATVTAIMKVVDNENPPLRLFLGNMPYELIKQRYAERLETWDEWAEVSIKAHGN